MNDIQIYQREEFGQVRTYLDEKQEAWFCGADVCVILDYENTRAAINRHVDEKDVTKCYTLTSGGRQQLTYVNESGLYSLILGSKMPKAKEFKHWVTSEVLPSIRKTGMYATPDTWEQLLHNPDFAIATFQRLKEEQEERIRLAAQVKAEEPKVLFADSVEASRDCILMRDLAKLLFQNGYKTGQNRLFEDLRRQGYLLSDNMPSQKAMNMGLFEIKETAIHLPNGDVKVNKTTKVTGKGQVYFIQHFLHKIS